MDPISIAVELELATLIIAAVGVIATWMNHRHRATEYQQRERHHREIRTAHPHPVVADRHAEAPPTAKTHAE